MTTSLPLRARVRGALRHPVRAGHVLGWRWRDDPALLGVYGLRVVPEAPVRLAARLLPPRLAPGLAALALERTGNRDRAAAVLAEATATGAGRSRRRHRLARTAIALGLPLPAADDVARSTALAAQAWRAGRWRDAAATAPSGTPEHERYAGELGTVEGEPLSLAAGRPLDPVQPVNRGVLHVVTNALPYTQAGYTVRTHAIATAQRARGYDAQVATRWGWPMLAGVFDAEPRHVLDGVPYHRLQPRGRVPARADVRLARNADALQALVRRLRPSVVHAATPHLNGTPAVVAARWCGLPFVYEVRGFLEETWLTRVAEHSGPVGESEARQSDRYLLTRAREDALMRQADVVVTIARAMGEQLVSRGVDRERVWVVPNGVDAGLLTAAPDRAGMRARFGIGSDELVVGSVSSLKPYEGFDTLVRAARLLVDAGVPVRVLLVGDGEHRARLRALAAELGLADTVLLPGSVPPDVAPAAVAALDVMVVPRTDTDVCRTVTPLKPVEAMALGVPVVASDLPALSEVLVDGKAGVLVPPEDPARLAEALAALHDDEPRRRDLVAAGRQEVSANRTWQSAAGTYEQIYRHLTGG